MSIINIQLDGPDNLVHQLPLLKDFLKSYGVTIISVEQEVTQINQNVTHNTEPTNSGLKTVALGISTSTFNELKAYDTLGSLPNIPYIEEEDLYSLEEPHPQKKVITVPPVVKKVPQVNSSSSSVNVPSVNTLNKTPNKLSNGHIGVIPRGDLDEKASNEWMNKLRRFSTFSSLDDKRATNKVTQVLCKVANGTLIAEIKMLYPMSTSQVLSFGNYIGGKLLGKDDNTSVEYTFPHRRLNPIPGNISVAASDEYFILNLGKTSQVTQVHQLDPVHQSIH